MSLPGRWTDDPVTPPPPPPPPAADPVKKPRRIFQGTNYSDPTVTQFCNEHVKDLDDLQQVEHLITSLNDQQTKVTTQIVEFENKLNTLRKDILDKSRTSLSATATFQSHYHDLTAQINNSWTTNYARHEGLAQLQALDAKRRDLLRARSYIQILLQVHDLSAKARSEIHTDPHQALETYTKLRDLANELSSRNEKAWSSMIHLTEYVEASTKQLWEELEQILSVDMNQALKVLEWPNPLPKNATRRNEGLIQLKLAFRKLSVLQQPTGALRSTVTLPTSNTSGGALLPFKVMAKEIDIRFRYHFEGDRPTNNIEKPEWFFQHILTTIQNHAEFLNDEVQSILNDIGIQRSALYEFITALLPIVCRKVDHILPDLLRNPSLLSHLMHENLVFDTTLREEYLYLPHGQGEWEGSIQHALKSQRVFKTWRDVEKNFAEGRYNDILSAKDASELEYEAVDVQEVKPTKGSMRIMDLLETFTDRFRGLAEFEQKLQFVVDIQLAILDLYYSKLKGNVEKFEISHPYALAGELREEGKKIAGVAGLERLCRVYGSATWIEDHLKDWTDEVFLEIYAEIIDRVKNDKPISSYTTADLTTRLSPSISSASDDGTLFDINVQHFHSLKDKSLTLIQSHIKRELFEEFRQYTNLLHWSSLGSQDGEEFSTNIPTNSRELLKALPAVTKHFSFLHKALSRQVFTRIFKSFSSDLQAYFWEWIVTAHRFTAPGGLLFARDMYAFWDACSKFISRPEQYMKRMHDAVVLLSLPSSVGVKVSEGDITLATVTKRLRETDETDLEKANELRNWLAEHLDVKTLALQEVLYIVRRRQECLW